MCKLMIPDILWTVSVIYLYIVLIDSSNWFCQFVFDQINYPLKKLSVNDFII